MSSPLPTTPRKLHRLDRLDFQDKAFVPSNRRVSAISSLVGRRGSSTVPLTESEITTALEKLNTRTSTPQMEKIINTMMQKDKTTRTARTVEKARRALQLKLGNNPKNRKHMTKAISQFRIRRISVETQDVSSRSIMDQQIVYPKSLIRPDRMIFRSWQMFIMVLVLYQSFILPYNIAFEESQVDTNISLTDTFFIVDLLLQFNVMVPSPDNPQRFIYHRKDIARMYFRSWFFIDLLAVIPFDMIVLAFQEDQTQVGLDALGLLKGLRLPRLLRLMRLLRVVKLFRINPELQRWLLYSRHANLWRLSRLVFLFLILTHVLACIWFGSIVKEKWLESNLDLDRGIMHAYWKSFYVCLLLVMGENIEPHAIIEIVFSSAVLLTGAVLMAIVFGNVAVLIANFVATQSAYQKKMEELYDAMEMLKLPPNLKSRIHRYYREMSERHGSLDGQTEDFVQELSTQLQLEVYLFERYEMLETVKLFQDCSSDFLKRVVVGLEFTVFMPHDYIVRIDQVSQDMYIVQSGICEVTRPCTEEDEVTLHRGSTLSALMADKEIKSPNERVIRLLIRGDYFNEISLLLDCRRDSNVRTKSFVELCRFSRQLFEEITSRYKEDFHTIQNRIFAGYDPQQILNAAGYDPEEVPYMGASEPELRLVLQEQNHIIQYLESLIERTTPKTLPEHEGNTSARKRATCSPHKKTRGTASSGRAQENKGSSTSLSEGSPSPRNRVSSGRVASYSASKRSASGSMKRKLDPLVIPSTNEPDLVISPSSVKGHRDVGTSTSSPIEQDATPARREIGTNTDMGPSHSLAYSDAEHSTRAAHTSSASASTLTSGSDTCVDKETLLVTESELPVGSFPKKVKKKRIKKHRQGSRSPKRKSKTRMHSKETGASTEDDHSTRKKKKKKKVRKIKRIKALSPSDKQVH